MRAEDALAKWDVVPSSFSESSTKVIIEKFDLITDVVTWCRRTKSMFGISSGVSVSMKDFQARLHPEDFDATAAAFATAIDLTAT